LLRVRGSTCTGQPPLTIDPAGGPKEIKITLVSAGLADHPLAEMAAASALSGHKCQFFNLLGVEQAAESNYYSTSATMPAMRV
jgi:hypothetical protein